ncbi:LtfC-like domain-containing protein [Prescottella equi]|uniref:LtfC-like domain-containing protein n=1 Tax=Rhodococcus hoagii TaxID=43767 RepID=UPI0007CD5DE5|nr:hypothetical protein [Prescottella equi]
MAEKMFGWQPTKRGMILSAGADFAQALRQKNSAGVFPEGTTARIDFVVDDEVIATWPATVEETEVSWLVQSTEADEIPDRAGYRLYISFPFDPPLDMLWFHGAVQRKQ